MRYLLGIIVLLFSTLIFAQEQITDISSIRYQEDFIDIIPGELNGESFNAYLDYYRVFIDFENENIEDYDIPYVYSCFRQRVAIEGKYLYIFSQSTLVIDIEARKMHDHYSFSDDWFFRSAQFLEGNVIIRLENNQGQFRYGNYDPDSKQKSLSDSHNQIFSVGGKFYFLDFEMNETIVGEINIQDWTEQVIYQGDELSYLGHGLFRDVEGYLYEGVLDSNPVKTCIPQYLFLVDSIIAIRYYKQEKYSIIESFDSIISEYNYYMSDDCYYQRLTSTNIPIIFDFYNENNFGFRAHGKYVRIRYDDFTMKFTIASSEDLAYSDEFIMSGDTAYLFTRKYINNAYEKQIIRYTPIGFFIPDVKKVIKTFSDDSNIVQTGLDESGNIKIMFNNSGQGVTALTLDPDGNEINSSLLFFPWYSDHDEKNVRWSSFSDGHFRKTQIDDSENYRIDRLEDGQVITDTMLITPYVDNEVEVTLMERDGEHILKFLNKISSTSNEVINPDFDLNYVSRMIRIDDEIWIISVDNILGGDYIFKFGLDGSDRGSFSHNKAKVLYHYEGGIIFSGSLGQFPRYFFHYDGTNVVQLSDRLTSYSTHFKVGGTHYVLSTFQFEIRLFEFDKNQIALSELEEFTGHVKNTIASVHNSLQSSKSFLIFEGVDNSSSFLNISFGTDGYKIDEFDFAESTYVGFANSFPVNGGYVYSIWDNSFNIFVDSNGINIDLPIDIDDDIFIHDIQQLDESIYLFGKTFYDNYIIKCDNEFNNCNTLHSFDEEYCQNNFITLLGTNEHEVYFSNIGIEPIETIWTLDTSVDQVKYYNNMEDTQIQFFERRDFSHKGYVYFTAARSDQNYQLFRLNVSEGPNSTNEIITKNKFTVYPNPTTNNTRITSDINLRQVSIFDIRGIEVFHGEFDREGGFTLPVINSGFYIIHAQDEDGNLYMSKLTIVN